MLQFAIGMIKIADWCGLVKATCEQNYAHKTLMITALDAYVRVTYRVKKQNLRRFGDEAFSNDNFDSKVSNIIV